MPKRKSKKLKPFSIVVFEPFHAKKYPEAYKKHPIKLGELVIFMGNIPNSPGHCVVAKHSGKVVWLVHPEDFRLATDEEV